MLEAKAVVDGSAPVRLVRAPGHAEKPLSELIRDGLVTITPELALRIIQECHYDRQRPVRPLHVSALAMQMRKKEWTPGTQIHFARMSDGWLRFLNGQHRLHAVIESNRAVEFQVLVSPAKNETDVGRLYRRHDRLAVARTVTDALKAEGIGETYALTNRMAEGCFKAALMIQSEFITKGKSAKVDPYLYRSDEARFRLCEPWWPIAELYQDALAKAPETVKRTLVKQGPMAVALLTLRDQEAKADAFWRGLANNDRLGRDDPRSAYLRFMNTEKVHYGFAPAKAASTAWNAFFTNETLRYIRLVDTPIKIAGCKVGV